MRPWTALLPSLLLACGAPGDAATAGSTSAGETHAATDGPPAGASTTGGGEAPTTSASSSAPATSTGETSSAPGETGEMSSAPGSTGEPPPQDPPDPLQARRGVMHLHSPYSHDACDEQGLMNGEPNPACLADLRAAVCSTGLDFALLTDHPAHMQEHPFLADLLYDEAAGDELVLEADAPVANRLRCADDRRVLLAVGYEATHTLPLGLHHHVDPAFYAGLTDAAPLDVAKALVAALQDAGAVVAMAHSEEDDLSAQRIVDVGLDAMEWYNPHGNFLNVFGGDSIASDPAALIDLFQALTPFMSGSNSGAHADLVYLQLLPSWPQAGFDKWREVQRQRPVTGILGSDVHQNVSVKPLCAQDDPVQQQLCVAGAKALLPDELDSLADGGTIQMSDGRRLDAYERILRWLENRVLTPPGELDLASLQDALRARRNIGLFSVFGEPEGLRFFARDAADAYLSIGDAAAGPLTLEVRAPVRPAPLHADGPQWSAADGDAAEVRVELWRTDADGTSMAATQTGLGAALSHPASEPGAYHVEVWVRPQHLKPALGDQQQLADAWYMWLLTNPIRVQ